MKKFISLFAFLFLCKFTTFAQSTMTDQQVLDYAKEAYAAGKPQKTIIAELSAKGVDRAQAERVKKLYENQTGGQSGAGNQIDNEKRSHTVNTPTANAEENDVLSSIHSDKEDDIVLDKSNTVFGRSIFQNKSLNFAPSENLATPMNYKLGPGDEVIIDIFGANQTTLRSTISPEGSINVDILGPVYLNGMSIDEANTFLKKKLSSIYAGLNRNDAGTDIKLSLGQIRTIQVNILGDVTMPGTYTLSSLSTVFHALYKAGGIKDPGTLRNIIVSRGGKNIATVDIYEFLMTGSRNNDIRLEEGDVILVNPYKCMVSLQGNVKRPMFFELKEGETLAKVLEYAGGFSQGAYTKNITVLRQTGKEYEVCTVDEMDYKVFKMKDGDEVQIGGLVSRFENRVSIKGAVFRSGIYQLNSETNTIKALINKAEGLMPEAFTNRAVLSREREDKTLEVISIDVAGILNGSVADVPLHNNDELYIPSKFDLTDHGTITINGEVAAPGTFVFAENMTLEDLILRAGGLLESASTVRVDVSRRVKDNTSQKAQKEIAQMFSFSVKDNYVIDGEVGFHLQPYDVVYVRRSPSYSVQKTVRISGEANFTGEYPLTEKEERLTSLLNKAGGATDYAYLKGARLVRNVNKEELERMKSALKTVTTSGDSISNEMIDLRSKYYVGIELEKAIANPGGVHDVVLREGDELEIPVYSNTVRIEGAVLSPNEVTYEPNKTVKYYIEQAGGYSSKAKRSKKYMIAMNGHITKAKRNSKVEPGAEIIVPMKEPRNGNMLQSTLGIATTAASLGTMAASIANILR